MSDVVVQSDRDERATEGAEALIDNPSAIIGGIFDDATTRPSLASLVGPMRALWEAGEWKAESIVAAVEAIDFQTIESSGDEAS